MSTGKETALSARILSEGLNVFAGFCDRAGGLPARAAAFLEDDSCFVPPSSRLFFSGSAYAAPADNRQDIISAAESSVRPPLMPSHRRERTRHSIPGTRVPQLYPLVVFIAHTARRESRGRDGPHDCNRDNSIAVR